MHSWARAPAIWTPGDDDKGSLPKEIQWDFDPRTFRLGGQRCPAGRTVWERALSILHYGQIFSQTSNAFVLILMRCMCASLFTQHHEWAYLTIWMHTCILIYTHTLILSCAFKTSCPCYYWEIFFEKYTGRWIVLVWWLRVLMPCSIPFKKSLKRIWIDGRSILVQTASSI